MKAPQMTATALLQSRPVHFGKLSASTTSDNDSTSHGTGADLQWMFALNQLYATELSDMTQAQFADHLARASYARIIERPVIERQAVGGPAISAPALTEPAAFILAFDQGANYNSPNFDWHKENLKQVHGAGTPPFFYVDRVVVSPNHQRRGLARRLYEELFAHADARGHGRVLCEVNSDPPNPASDAFHASLGFKRMGEARLPERQKTVQYLGRIGKG